MFGGTVGVVGAGGAGLVTAQALVARGLEPVVYEARDGLGGNWRYDPQPGRSSCYASLKTNTWRKRTSLKAHPMSWRGPANPGHAEMLAYLDGYATRFDLHRRIRLNAEVVAATPQADGGWVVETADGGSEAHTALVVAAGYNSRPVLPDWEGTLDGPLLHTHDYRTPEPFVGRDVIVVGMGCSATELACEISHVANSLVLLARSGRDVVSHKVGGLPSDLFDSALNARLPWSVRRRMIAGISRLAMDDHEKYDLPRRQGRTGDAPIAVCADLRAALRSGRVRGATGEIARLAGDRVVLTDGRELPAGALLAGTGYETAFDFLPAEAEAPSYAHAPLYRGVASLAMDDLFYVGLVGAHGALLPMMEAQATWIAAALSGHLELPDRETMRASVAADEAVRVRDFDGRFGVLYDRMPYVLTVTREARRGGRPTRAAEPTLA